MNAVHSGAESGTRLGKRRKEREERILEAAAELVAAEGIEALSVHRLARELDYVPAALYRYFASKDELVAKLQRRAIAALHADFRGACTAAEATGGTPRARALGAVFVAARFYLTLPERSPEHFRLVSALLADPRPLVGDAQAKKTAPVLVGFLGDVAALLERAAETGAIEPGDAFDRTLILWSSLQGILQLGKLGRFDGERFDPKRLGERAVRDLLAGWGASAAALEKEDRS